MTKAIGLISGGLDSRLAVKVLQEQGIEVIGLSFVTPFFSSANAQAAALQLGIPLRIIDFTQRHLVMLKNPKHGYGADLNPFIQFHTLMLREAGGLLETEGADLLFTGEVLGERPMSQNRASLMLVAKESGYKDIILRPLSAKLLPETRPELDGKVDRARLLDISGRSRKRQIELAQIYRITDYPNPASGCLLTDPGYSRRLKDMFKFKPDFTGYDAQLLKYGRHFRLGEHTKMVIGRNQSDNDALLRLRAPDDVIVDIPDYPGPITLISGPASWQDILYAASICAFYTDSVKGKEVTATIESADGKKEIKIKAIENDSFKEKTV